jgi:hypothetical protein
MNYLFIFKGVYNKNILLINFTKVKNFGKVKALNNINGGIVHLEWRVKFYKVSRAITLVLFVIPKILKFF